MKTKLAAVLAGAAIVIAGTTFYLSPTPATQTAVVAPDAAPIAATQPATTKAGPAEIYPDVPGALNPDINQGNISQNLCNPGWSTKSIRPPVSVTDPIKTVALARYNREFGTSYVKADGELDHIVSLELGGAPSDPQNLYFEPYTTQVNGAQVGAHEKDKVENELHKEVCSGQLTLSQAQHIITTDWYAFFLTHKL